MVREDIYLHPKECALLSLISNYTHLQCMVKPRDKVVKIITMHRGSACLDLFNYNNWRLLLSAMCPDIDWEAGMQQY